MWPLYDVLGRQSFYESRTNMGGKQTLELDVAKLPRMVYLLSIQTQKANKVVRVLKE